LLVLPTLEEGVSLRSIANALIARGTSTTDSGKATKWSEFGEREASGLAGRSSTRWGMFKER